jgi:peptidoglycan/xylan/chitin deacetylase (PgdA/CDA1 family)
MGSGLSRFAAAVAVPVILWAGASAAVAGDCSGNPNAIGTSRTIVVDPREHTKIGTMDYVESLPLNDHEVVLTFDDGPLPAYSSKVLEILASQCVKATYFMVGSMAKAYPAMAKRIYDEGHTVGTHSMTHPTHFRRLSVERGNAEIDDGIAAVGAALGGEDKVAPFFRFPGFGWTAAAEQHAALRGLMVWGADVPADDWLRLGPREVARRAVQRLEHKGKGILLLHDIHQRTVDALPSILDELKNRGFKIVQVVPASADRTPTVTAAADWVPNSRRAAAALPMPPVILIADVQEPDGDGLGHKSDEQLCMLSPPHEYASRIRHQRHEHMARMAARPETTGSAKPLHGKSKPSKLAHADGPKLDIHAVQ